MDGLAGVQSLTLESKAHGRDLGRRALLSAIVTCGLTLGTRDWIAKNPGELRRLTSGSSKSGFTLFSSTFFAPILPGLYGRHLEIFQLLLDNGFRIGADPYFFPLICSALFGCGLDAEVIIGQSALLEAATLVLKHGQVANAKVELQVTLAKHITASALHVCLPALAEQVLRYGGNPNCVDEYGWTALDWLLDASYIKRPKAWNCQRRYDMCRILIGAGGSVSHHAGRQECLKSLAEFEGEGYDTRLFYDDRGGLGSAISAKGRSADSSESWYSALSGDE